MGRSCHLRRDPDPCWYVRRRLLSWDVWQALHLATNERPTMVQARLAELLYIFMLCFVVLNIAASRKHGGKNQFYCIDVGFVTVVGAYSGSSA